MRAVSVADVYGARQRLAGVVARTPLVSSPTLSARVGTAVYLKLESRQLTGSFKLRGAANAIAHLDAAALRRGVVTASTGNHGRALAHAAFTVGARAVICLSALVPHNKVEAIRALGAELRIVGRSQDDALREAERLAVEEGMTLVPPFDDPRVIAGQGTIGLEILEDLPDVGGVLVPLSGGGLLAGVALVLETARPSVAVLGVSMEAGCAMHASLRAGKPVEVEEVPTLADSLGGGIGVANRHTFAMVQQLADASVLVGEASIARAVRHAYREEREVVEGAAAVGIAALLDDKIDLALVPGPIVVVLSGRNVDMDLHARLITGAAA
ncbi:MAG: hydroxyectoine utilization dehydratase EutB [Gemmatimonadota bacterium]